jgi:hypothetical protein
MIDGATAHVVGKVGCGRWEEEEAQKGAPQVVCWPGEARGGAAADEAFVIAHNTLNFLQDNLFFCGDHRLIFRHSKAFQSRYRYCP